MNPLDKLKKLQNSYNKKEEEAETEIVREHEEQEQEQEQKLNQPKVSNPANSKSIKERFKERVKLKVDQQLQPIKDRIEDLDDTLLAIRLSIAKAQNNPQELQECRNEYDAIKGMKSMMEDYHGIKEKGYTKHYKKELKVVDAIVAEKMKHSKKSKKSK